MEVEIASARERWGRALNKGSAEEFVRCITEDSVWLPPRGDGAFLQLALGAIGRVKPGIALLDQLTSCFGDSLNIRILERLLTWRPGGGN